MKFSDADPQRTWDGLEVAKDEPYGTTVVVRRPAGAGFEYLLLHRAERGIDYEGDWAWTAPAGARQPGESVLPSAERELAEEAGITGFPLWPVDLSGTWAVFGCDVPVGTSIGLVDPEHDRYEWVSFDQARARVRPAWVAEGNFCPATAAATPRITFRPDSYDDLPAAGTPSEQAFIAALEGMTPDGLHVVYVDDERSGYIAHYRLGASDEAELGLAVTIDDEAVGPRVIWSYLRDLVQPGHRDVQRVFSTGAGKVLERAGFTPPAHHTASPTPAPHTLDLPHHFGSHGHS